MDHNSSLPDMAVTPAPTTSIPLDAKLTTIQNRLFQKAHAEPLELKFLGIALDSPGSAPPSGVTQEVL
ncbi:hypothetical protein BBFGKLBO_00724 [Synechococcus sp. CBW1107]|nr:hypothetical protein BBFGKLBO_00724 [Synechococcus sp. CBW1107]